MRVDFDKDRIKSLKLVPVEANEILKTQKMQKRIQRPLFRRSCREGLSKRSKSHYLSLAIQRAVSSSKPVGPGLKQVLSNNGTRDQDVT